jgi:hypothetical protein
LEDVFQVTPVGVVPHKPPLDVGILVDEAGLERYKVGRCRGRYSWLKICIEIAAVAVVLAGYAYKNKDKPAQVTF